MDLVTKEANASTDDLTKKPPSTLDIWQKIALLKVALSKIPLLSKTALFHTLGLSETSREWDLKTELVIHLIRSFMDGPATHTLSQTQKMTLRDQGIKGKMWISKVTAPAPDNDSLQTAVDKAIEGLRVEGVTTGGYKMPSLDPVGAEWTGYRMNASGSTPELPISEAEKYEHLMKEVSSDLTILYFHGGAFYLMDPSSHRLATVRLARMTKGRVLSVRYRLAPQNMFPAALLDALVAYSYLLYPPEGAFHDAVPPSKIVFSGDSAGGNVCMSLLQTLLEFQRQNLTFMYNGEERVLPLPAGVALNSGWLDITHALPSCTINAKYDYLPDLRQPPRFKPCNVWPPNPPRLHFYSPDGFLCHPLVSPMAAKSWEGSCPVYFSNGQELLLDENKYVAATMAKQGVKVVVEEFDTMPHCFALIFSGSAGGRLLHESWTTFMCDAITQPDRIKTSAKKYAAKTLKETDVKLEELSTVTREEVLKAMQDVVEHQKRQSKANMAKL